MATIAAACAVTIAVLLPVATAAASGASSPAATATTANPHAVLLIGPPSFPTTQAWQAGLDAEGVPYTLAPSSGKYGAETVTLPPLTSGSTGSFDGVVFADSPAAYAPGQPWQAALDSYEATFRVRQLDGYAYPSLGLTPLSSGGSFDGSTASLTSAGKAALPDIGGTVRFDVGTFGYPASAVSPFTPWLLNAKSQVLAGVYAHPITDPQAGVEEAVLLFDYNPAQLQWLQLGPDLIDWITGQAPAVVGANQGNLPAPVVGIASTPKGDGYWLADAAGGVSPHGTARNFGSLVGLPLNAPITHIVATPDGGGYWLVASDGGVFAFGDARFHGSMGGRPLNAPVVALTPTSDGGGYWLVASDGGVFAFGDAHFYGSMGGRSLNEPVVGIAADAATGGYWLVASDGGIFAFGRAPFLGSAGALPLSEPINGMAVASGDQGYWLVASDGGIFAFGDARFHGSTGAYPINAPVVGVAVDHGTYGYWLVGSDGGVYSFDAPFYGAD